MLTHLSIDNYALIDKLDINFMEGLNTITGETGAGKSILIGALSLISGSRADAGVLGNKSRNCVIEATFDIGKYNLQTLFDDLDIDFYETTTIKRIINSEGKSRAYVNDLPVTVGALKTLSNYLIDIHSQHQTLLLGESDFQMSVIDTIARNQTLRNEYGLSFTSLKNAREELACLETAAKEESKEHDFIEFQYNQLKEASLAEGIETELEAAREELAHAGEIKSTLSESAVALNDSEQAAIITLKQIQSSIKKIEKVYSRAEEFSGRIDSCIIELKDLYSELDHDANRIEDDPTKLAQIEEKLDKIYTLFRKHGVTTVAELLEIKNDLESKLDKINNYDSLISDKKKAIIKLENKAIELASKITETRKTAKPVLENFVIKTLSELGMPNSVIDIKVSESKELKSDGRDIVDFLFSANKGSVPQPIQKVASGGELSRLMLAIKAMMATHTDLSTIIFDEIDTGVSGNIADKMGEIIFKISESRQIINITHLPQIASKGKNHFFVYKEEKDGTTQSMIKKLSDDQRVDQIARMISGVEVTDAAIAQAKALINGK